MDGEPIAFVDADGRVVAGQRPAGETDVRRTVTLHGRAIGEVVGSASGHREHAEVVGLVARALELALGAASEHAERARVAQEMAIGRRIQLSLVPRKLPDAAGWTFGAAYEPAREVGGDLFDAFRVRGDPTRFALLVADVTGKGIPAALLMADARALLHAATDNASGPGDALGRVNRILVDERRTTLFVTAVLLVVDATTGEIAYAGAGHEPPFVARAGGAIEALTCTGPILGAFPNAAFVDHAARLSPGDALVVYTDGITDTRDPEGRFYGEERLLVAIGGAEGGRADEIVAAITEDVHAFRGAAEPFDDLTLLVAEWRPRP